MLNAALQLAILPHPQAIQDLTPLNNIQAPRILIHRQPFS